LGPHLNSLNRKLNIFLSQPYFF